MALKLATKVFDEQGSERVVVYRVNGLTVADTIDTVAEFNKVTSAVAVSATSAIAATCVISANTIITINGAGLANDVLFVTVVGSSK